jgi:hypothetical protein
MTEEDPWDQFDPEVARALKAVFKHTFDNTLKPMQDEAEDLAFAAEEDRMRSIYGEAYDRHRFQILEFAAQNGITNLDVAVRAYRAPQDPAFEQAAPSEQAPEPHDEHEARVARLEALKYDDSPAAERERSELRHLERQWQDERVLEIAREANGRTDARADTLRELGELQARRKASNKELESADLKSERVSPEEGRLAMGARAIELMRGKTPESVSGPSRAEREADIHGLSSAEQILSESIHERNVNDAT